MVTDEQITAILDLTSTAYPNDNRKGQYADYGTTEELIEEVREILSCQKTQQDNESQVSVIRPGSNVFVGEGIKATVLRVEVNSNNHVKYCCAWFDGRVQQAEWLEEFEVSVCEEFNKFNIGFLP